MNENSPVTPAAAISNGTTTPPDTEAPLPSTTVVNGPPDALAFAPDEQPATTGVPDELNDGAELSLDTAVVTIESDDTGIGTRPAAGFGVVLLGLVIWLSARRPARAH